jgi:hypothetical protein
MGCHALGPERTVVCDAHARKVASHDQADVILEGQPRNPATALRELFECWQANVEFGVLDLPSSSFTLRAAFEFQDGGLRNETSPVCGHKP